MPGYRYYCKSDDDTLVHLDHLTALVDELQRALPADKPVYLGHTKWRGWDGYCVPMVAADYEEYMIKHWRPEVM